jgi:hypothetical protein
MVTVVIAGGGASGCGAALAARQAGAAVVLVERTDLLMTGALRAGRMNTNAKIIAAEESKELGSGAIFEAIESIAIHHKAELPGEEFTYVYDCGKVEPLIRELVRAAGIEIVVENRVAAVEQVDGRIAAVRLDDGRRLEADAFLDTTGSSGGLDVCVKYGKGCVECIYRCPTFGDRVSLVAASGVAERARVRPNGKLGAIGSGVTIHKRSIRADVVADLERAGELTIPFPPELIDYSKVEQQTATRTKRQMEFLNVTDIGIAAKCTGLTYLPLEDLRRIPGFEGAQYESPLAAGRFNRISRVAISPWELSLHVEGVDNLFCAGEKLGVSGVAEAVSTGSLAGHNAVRHALGVELLVLPRTTGLGEYLAWSREQMALPDGLTGGYSLGNGAPVGRLKELGFYGSEPGPLRARVAAAGLSGVLAKRLV